MRRRLSRFPEVVPFIVRVGSPQVDQGTRLQTVLPRCHRNELPHPLGNAGPGLGAALGRVEAALLKREVKELRGEIIGKERA